MIASDTTAAAEKYQDIFKGLASALNEHMDGNVDEAKVREIAAQEISKARLPQPIEVHLADKVVQLEGTVHAQFTELLDLIAEGHNNLMMVGPAGSGKTTLAKNVAKALDMDFAFISLSSGVTETHLFGRMLPQADGTWGYVPSRFVEVYENGGVYLLDEIDAADSNVMVAINAALANGVLANPVNGKVHVRHASTIIIAAANTWGRGADHQYVGRNQLDAATLDRFVLATLHVLYDGGLETQIARSMLSEVQADELLAWVNALRERITDNRLRRVASTRLVVSAGKALAKGKSLADVKRRFHQDWSRDELVKVAGV